MLNEWNVTVSAEFPTLKDWNDELLANHQEESESRAMTTVKAQYATYKGEVCPSRDTGPLIMVTGGRGTIPGEG